MKVLFKKLEPAARMPARAYNSAGYDVFCLEDVFMQPGTRQAIRTGIATAFEPGYVALIWDKGSTASKGIRSLAGVVDADYRGEWIIWLHNLSDKPMWFDAGQKIAQVLFQRVEEPVIEEVESLPESLRGSNCLGSSGAF
jgi:dUTP pyrophosphatase